MEHYCDRCGAQSRTRWTKGDRELIFCGHHNREYEENLSNGDWEVDFAYDYDPSLVAI